MLESVTVNWSAIVLAGVVNIVLGALWYSTPVFGKSWMELMQIKEMKPNPKHLLGMFVIALGIAYIFSQLLGWAKIMDYSTGLQAGLFAGFGLIALPLASNTLAANGSWKLWMIVAGYWVVALGIMGSIVAGMR